jgi:hypothetical protein
MQEETPEVFHLPLLAPDRDGVEEHYPGNIPDVKKEIGKSPELIGTGPGFLITEGAENASLPGSAKPSPNCKQEDLLDLLFSILNVWLVVGSPWIT